MKLNKFENFEPLLQCLFYNNYDIKRLCSTELQYNIINGYCPTNDYSTDYDYRH